MRTLAISDPCCTQRSTFMPWRSWRSRSRTADLGYRQGGARAEGRLIQRVTELLREVSARRRPCAVARFRQNPDGSEMQSIVLGTAGVLIGLSRQLLVFAAPCGAGLDRGNSIRAVGPAAEK